jgi:hypothetical protein
MIHISQRWPLFYSWKYASIKQLTLLKSKKICCFYGPSTKTKHDLHIIPEKRHNCDRINSLKKECKYPFEIRYSFIEYHKDSNHPDKRLNLFILLRLPEFTTTIHVCLTLSMPGKVYKNIDAIYISNFCCGTLLILLESLVENYIHKLHLPYDF